MSSNSDAEINRLKISIKDIEEAHDYLKAHNSGLEIVIQRALLTAAIVAYSRPFKKNKRGKDLQSAATIPKEVEASMDDNELALHGKVIDLRDEAVAHSDFDRKPTRRMPSKAESEMVMMWNQTFDVLSENIDVDQFRDLTWKVQCLCVDRLFQIRKAELSSGSGVPADAVTEANESMVVSDGDGDMTIRIPLHEFGP